MTVFVVFSCIIKNLKTHSDKNSIFGVFNMFLWTFSDGKGHIENKI